LATALALLSLPRELGAHPQNGQPVTAHNGRFGPYVKCGEESRSLPSGVSPLSVTLQEALELLAKPKPGRGPGRRREPIRTFEPSPVTNQPVQLLAGRYGPYVTDGTTNASLPRGTDPEQITVEQALGWLAARAAQAPSGRFPRRKSARKTAATSAAPKKKAKKRSSGKKKAPRKRTAKKPASPGTEESAAGPAPQ
jgi:DNA topoisomerase-1